MKKILIATKNKGKLNDIKEIFKDLDIEILSFLDFDDSPDVDETGNTFEENAQLKAKACYDKFKIPSIGDDSGLVVEQLNGEPGIYSARYAGENANDYLNNEKLIKQIQKFPEPHRAKFVCVASYFDGEKFVNAYGEVKGRIITEPRGKNGFGYDPLFIPNGYDKTFGELSHEEKNKISHRSMAFRKLHKKLEALL
ncbi:MAG: XTP/dITP diphosphatase [Ignavibacterium album]|uniref:XTP/dITP diphosphatase n=1 Tax=Ignavibacterium album TaxID=591197 RepID=UPI0026F04157|nr:XTP/dITP diphosphatase [Ignavibacterium album]MCX8106676.1 XTP/dITP diphosphatase [Ignavibacterium album]